MKRRQKERWGKDGDIHQKRKRWGHPSKEMRTSINWAKRSPEKRDEERDEDIHQLGKKITRDEQR